MNSDQKQVIFVLHTISVGGAERQLSSVANVMAEAGISVKMVLLDNAAVVFPLRDGVEAVCINSNVKNMPTENVSPCTLFNSGRKATVTAFEKVKLQLIRDKQARAVEEEKLFFRLHYAQPLHEYLKSYPGATIISCMTIPNIATMMATKDLPNRVVFSDRTDPQLEYPADHPIVALKKKYYPRANAAVFQTPDARDYYDWLPGLETHMIPNFIRSDLLPPPYDGERRHDIVSFSRLHPVKNIPMMIAAFKRLLSDYPDYTLHIYGEGEIKDELEQLIIDEGLYNAVKMVGFDTKIHLKVRDAAMFVSTSDREGISNSMLEAMAIGLPTICTDCPAGGARLTIKNGENGLLIPVRDEDALYAAMRRVLEEPGLSEKLSKNAVKLREELTIEKVA
ncbi:MAG: glycosyltransferase, partial [Deltaproteobacteria bacterium]|nr:glycosyltransferase [Deltaproteobacteria bacterium]